MSEKKKLMILIAAMVAIIGGAVWAYNAFGDSVQMPGLVVQSSSGEENSEKDTDKAVAGIESEATSIPEPEGESEADANGTESSEDADGAQELAPDFTVYDGEGNACKLSDFRGKPVIVNFWASWCGPCKSEMPDFQEIYDTYGEEIHFLMVNMTDGAQETLESASSFIAESGYTFPVYYDTDMDAAYTYGVYSIPTTYFFDAEGHGVAYGQGAMDKETILTGIGMILKDDE